jgi:tetratricopeptide (TPR) repeat protein
MTTARRLICISLLLSAALFLAIPAQAGPKEDIRAGNTAAQARKYKEAIKLYTRAIKSGKLDAVNLAVAYNNRGSAYDDQNLTAKAMKDFSQAIKVKPNYAEAYYNRSFAYEKKGLLPQALNDIERAVRLQPGDKYYANRLEYLNHRLAGAGGH